MRKMLFVLFFVPGYVFASTPSTTCPSGYTAVSPSVTTTVSETCPSGTVSVGVAESCLVSDPSGVCIMYVPADTVYRGQNGKYVYRTPCPLE